MNYRSLSKLENDLLTEDQKRELANFDRKTTNSNNRWNKRIAFTLPPQDCLQLMEQSITTRLDFANALHCELDEESGP
jgi:hypothetical protein